MKQFNAMMPGGTYRVTYTAKEGQQRTALAMFHGLITDTMVPDPETGQHTKQAYKFTLMSPRIYDHDLHRDVVIDAPAHVEIRMDLWPEDVLMVTPATKGS